MQRLYYLDNLKVCLTVFIAVHAVIFVLTTVGIRAENIVSKWHSATLTKSHFFHISLFIFYTQKNF